MIWFCFRKYTVVLHVKNELSRNIKSFQKFALMQNVPQPTCSTTTLCAPRKPRNAAIVLRP